MAAEYGQFGDGPVVQNTAASATYVKFPCTTNGKFDVQELHVEKRY